MQTAASPAPLLGAANSSAGQRAFGSAPETQAAAAPAPLPAGQRAFGSASLTQQPLTAAAPAPLSCAANNPVGQSAIGGARP